MIPKQPMGLDIALQKISLGVSDLSTAKNNNISVQFLCIKVEKVQLNHYGLWLSHIDTPLFWAMLNSCFCVGIQEIKLFF